MLERLANRQNGRDQPVAEDRTVERPFGWLFFLVQSAAGALSQAEETRYRLIIVNKHVEQVIESSIDYTPERLIEVYEKLLATSHARGPQWCLTMPLPFPWKLFFGRERLAAKAKELGLYEIK
jgi:hypothetical protein